MNSEMLKLDFWTGKNNYIASCEYIENGVKKHSFVCFNKKTKEPNIKSEYVPEYVMTEMEKRIPQ